MNREAARKELSEYERKGYPVYVAQVDGTEIVGYLVCRVDGNVVWAESLFVMPEHRRRRIGSALYAQAEALTAELGGETVYNWVDPDNDAMIELLVGRGYNVLNLIELRRARHGEQPERKIKVGKHEFDT